ncbi:Odorant receptor 420 [Nylanderia fulva]|uniref:Odorant receptor 420 n=1 Tax=Nylanderia fulva TaxID=613905 RepID=A0A6G1LRL8_9HYME|nr:Odorant receptor 420 [Nylanderia fulva]
MRLIKLVEVCRSWPYQKPRERRFIFIFTMILVINAMVPQVAQFFVCENMECVYETIPPHMLAIMLLIKYFTLHLNKNQVKDLTDRLFINWNKIDNEEERKLWKNMLKTGKWYSKMYLILYRYRPIFIYRFHATRVGLHNSLNTSRPLMLPYPAYYFVNEEKYFYIIFFAIFYLMPSYATFEHATDIIRELNQCQKKLKIFQLTLSLVTLGGIFLSVKLINHFWINIFNVLCFIMCSVITECLAESNLILFLCSLSLVPNCLFVCPTYVASQSIRGAIIFVLLNSYEVI